MGAVGFDAGTVRIVTLTETVLAAAHLGQEGSLCVMVVLGRTRRGGRRGR